MSTPEPGARFNPNAALKQFNQYFGNVRSQYGEQALRNAGITPRELAKLQAQLRTLQMDNSATPEQHRAALSEVMGSIGQRLTAQGMTPNVSQRREEAPPVPVTPVMEARGVMPSMPELARPPMLETARPEIPVTPPPPMRLYVDPEPRTPVPSATDYIASMVAQPKPAELPMPPVGSPALLGDAPRPIDPSMVQPTAPGILPGITQMQPAAPSMNTQPGADFDRNVGRQIFDSEFRTLREKYGDEGLRAAGFTPRTLSALQAPLTNIQRDNTISYDQSSAALENALKQLRGYNFGGAQPAAPAPMMAPMPSAPPPVPAGAQQSPIPGYYRGGPAMRYR